MFACHQLCEFRNWLRTASFCGHKHLSVHSGDYYHQPPANRDLNLWIRTPSVSWGSLRYWKVCSRMWHTKASNE